MYLSIIVPAYNEERNIKRTLEDIYRYVSARSISHELLVVVNGSDDRTAEIARSMTTGMPTLRVIELTARGKGLAVREGMLSARGDYRLFTDADNSTSIDHLERMMPHFENGHDVVIGSIAVEGREITAGSEPAWRRTLGKMGNVFIQVLAVPGISDTQRGFKIFTADAANRIFPRLTKTGWGFDVEVLALARRFGYRIKQVPVRWKNNPDSHVTSRAYVEVLLETIGICWNLRTGMYEDGRGKVGDQRRATVGDEVGRSEIAR